MKKFMMTVMAGFIATGIWAAPLEINGSLKVGADGKLTNWRFDNDKVTPGTMEIIPGENGGVKLTAGNKRSVALVHTKKLPAKTGETYKMTVEVSQGTAFLLGLYMSMPNGSYLTAIYRSVRVGKDNKATCTFTLKDTTNKGREIGFISPYVRIFNGLSMTVKNITVEKVEATK